MKKYLTFLLFSLFSISIFATTVTWNGGTGYWTTASGWDTGTVPTASDEVIIPSGTVLLSNTNAFANQVTIESGAVLKIYSSGTLEVDGTVNADAITVDGTLKNSGTLTVENLSSPTNSFLDAINVSGTLTNYGDIDIDTDYFRGRGIFTTGDVYNKGDISVVGGSNSFHLYSGGYVYNSGDITSHAGSTAVYSIFSAQGFYNRGGIIITDNTSAGFSLGSDFENASSGSIVLVSNVAISGITNNSSGEFTNSGSIVILGPTSYGLRNAGFFENKHGAALEVISGSNTDLYNEGEMVNGGNINLNDDGNHSLSNSGTINNETTGYIYTHTMNNFTGGYFTNDGTIDQMSTVTAYGGLDNHGTFVNLGCGEMELRLDVRNYLGGVFYSKGLIRSESTATHSNSGNLDNYGILEDNPGTLYPLFTNDRIIGRELPGPIFSNAPKTNALLVNSLTNFTINGWYTSQALTTSAGFYNSTNNTFYPNSNAYYLPTLYVEATCLSTGCDFVFEISISNTPLTGSGGNSALMVNQSGTTNAEISVFPNPSNGTFKVRLPELEEGQYELILTDLTGKVIFEKSQPVNTSDIMDVTPNDLLPDGVYFLRVNQNEQLLTTEKLIVKH